MEIRGSERRKFTWKWTIDGRHFLCEILKVQVEKNIKKHLHFQVKCDNIDKDAVVYQVIFLDSSMVEHSAVNRGVVGSSPTRGADLKNLAPWSSG